MDWGTLVAAVGGGFIAITGTVLADHLRHRHEAGRGLNERRRAVYIEFISAAEGCHSRLRQIAQAPGAAGGDGAGDLDALTRAALTEATIYEVRERLFIDASSAVAGAGQVMFERLRALRKAVATGATQTSPAFHAAYHPYIGSVWSYRVAVRKELDGQSLSPEEFGWSSWDGRDRCPLCSGEPQDGA
ncbi:CchlQ [Streptomyces sp. NPDC002853]